jgi:hypothetical protein
MAFEDWGFRKELVIDSSKVAGTLTDFPLLIHLKSDSGLAANAQNNGDDIAFVAADETTQLSHEIEAFNGTTGTLWAHVKLPTLPATSDTEIYIYYGNPSVGNQESVTDVWKNRYEAVYHLNDTDGTATDSAGTADGDVVGATSTVGEINDAFSFSTDDLIDVSTDVIGGGNIFYFESWIKPNVLDNFDGIVQFSRNIGGFVGNGQFHLQDGGENTLGAPTPSLTVNKFQRVAGAVDESTSTYSLWRNDSERTTVDSNGAPLSTSKIEIGQRVDNGDFFNGKIDEVRVGTQIHSDDFQKTSYLNQDDPLLFYQVGPEETLGTPKDSVTTATAATTASIRGQQSVTASAVDAKSTAIETKSRFFKFASTQATTSTQAATGPQVQRIEFPADATVSLLTLFNLEELTENRRSIDGTDDTNATFQTLSDVVEYDQLPDDVEYEQ